MQKKLTFTYISLAALIFIFGYFPQAVENYYSRGFYLITSFLQRYISSIFPFAIGDFLYALFVIYILKNIIFFISRQKKTKKDYTSFGLKSINFVLIIYISFKLLWGLNYARPRINEQLQISNQPYQKEQLLRLSSFFLQKLSSLSQSADSIHFNYTTNELEDIAATAYNQLAEKQPFFRYKYMSVKPVTSAWLVSKTGIEGYYNPLSGEANINQRLPNFVLPFVTCHEIAHQIGVAKEDEANLVGYLTAIQSKNKQFQYSAYYNMLRYVLFEIRMKYPEDYNIIIEKIPESILDNFKKEREFWAKYNGAMSVYMGKTFDKILKLNNQRKGIKSYQDIVLWLVNYHKREL
ncbi:DUF3810 domain-containing protein [Pedobacter sp. SL55]|uniref:DUF3810 domain-containing protein n=1 Tax=Pedobacter sp. SL55 TaxID=2995161 RepID=UPI002272158C|nr:DUF3810 domain-containing protein [Pedobacter sp. SL55]WAC40661.1 DUF3810 domain-containing protein [Pedobacter sp. SL55]